MFLSFVLSSLSCFACSKATLTLILIDTICLPCLTHSFSLSFAMNTIFFLINNTVIPRRYRMSVSMYISFRKKVSMCGKMRTYVGKQFCYGLNTRPNKKKEKSACWGSASCALDRVSDKKNQVLSWKNVALSKNWLWRSVVCMYATCRKCLHTHLPAEQTYREHTTRNQIVDGEGNIFPKEDLKLFSRPPGGVIQNM